MEASSKIEQTVTSVAKAILFCMPVTLATEVFQVKSHFAVGLWLVVGSLLQALVPPRRKHLIPIVVLATAGAVVYMFLSGP